MDREQAIKEIKEITGGAGVDRDRYPNGMRGRFAQSLWDDGAFTLGIEYGYVLALMDAYSITESELNAGNN